LHGYKSLRIYKLDALAWKPHGQITPISALIAETDRPTPALKGGAFPFYHIRHVAALSPHTGHLSPTPRLKLYRNLSKDEKRPRARSMRYPASQPRKGARRWMW
jgi:hypothetical protein